VLGLVAAGGMGEVYRARDAVLEREVAIKVLHPTLAGDSGFVERFRREARSAAGLNHPNVVNVHDWGAVDRVYFMVMEYVRGQSLRDVLNAEGLLAPGTAAEVLLQVLAALDHAHRKGIVHRDV
jgi:serine/threonine protein kinase